MKLKYIFALTFAICAFVATEAQDVICHMPQTEVCIYITTEVTTSKQGMFYQYSERYLGTKDVVMADKTTCRLVSATIGTTAKADRDNTFSFKPGQPGLSTFCLTRDGILKSINITEQKSSQKKNAQESDETSKKHKCKDAVYPFSEDALLASSTARMAESTAKQIYRLREARLNLLSGDVDKMPADGSSMKQVLQEITRQEQELTSLFVGTVTKETRTETIVIPLADLLNLYETEQKAEITAFRFSSLTGLVGADDYSGAPYYLNMTDVYRPVKPEPEKKAPVLSNILYCVPGSAFFELIDENGVVTSATVMLSQLGYNAALPADYLKTAPAIRFDRKTGTITEAQ